VVRAPLGVAARRLDRDRSVYIVGRTDTLALPGFLLLLACGWHAWRARWIAASAAALWIVAAPAALAPFWNDASRAYKRNDRELATLLAAEVKAGDAIVLGPLARPTLEYYAHRLGFEGRLAWLGSYPPLADSSPGSYFPTPLDSAAAYAEQALRLRRGWEEAGIGRLWLLTSKGDEAPPRRTRRLPIIRPRHRPDKNTSTRTMPPFPMNLLLAHLVALRPVRVVRYYRQDWTGGTRYLLRTDRSDWVPVDSLPRIEVRP